MIKKNFSRWFVQVKVMYAWFIRIAIFLQPLCACAAKKIKKHFIHLNERTFCGLYSYNRLHCILIYNF